MVVGDDECNTELCLTAGGGLRSNKGDAEKRQNITIFYGGRVCVCDATELQARAIISMARRELEEATMKTTKLPEAPPAMPRTESELLNPGLSMKKSLQRFLQKRKTRVCGTVPYQLQKREALVPEAPDASSYS